jgi:hypothetical protein
MRPIGDKAVAKPVRNGDLMAPAPSTGRQRQGIRKSRRALVVVPVMGIRHMGVAVPLWHMPVPVAVRALRHLFVTMFVVPVIVPMRVLMLQRFVFMLMVVRLGQVQRNAQQHQQTASRHAPAG